MTERVTGESQLTPLCIDPAVLAKLRPGQSIDEDPATGYSVVVSGGGDAKANNAVILTESAGAKSPRSDFVYDRGTGLLSGFGLNDPVGHSQTIMTLKDRE